MYSIGLKVHLFGEEVSLVELKQEQLLQRTYDEGALEVLEWVVYGVVEPSNIVTDGQEVYGELIHASGEHQREVSYVVDEYGGVSPQSTRGN
jgi:hypothetical protein